MELFFLSKFGSFFPPFQDFDVEFPLFFDFTDSQETLVAPEEPVAERKRTNEEEEELTQYWELILKGAIESGSRDAAISMIKSNADEIRRTQSAWPLRIAAKKGNANLKLTKSMKFIYKMNAFDRLRGCLESTY